MTEQGEAIFPAGMARRRVSGCVAWLGREISNVQKYVAADCEKTWGISYMKVGLFAPLASPVATGEFVRCLGAGAEERGFHSIWAGEHVVLFDDPESAYPYADNGRLPVPAGSGMLEPFTALSFLAAATSRIRLGTGVCLVPQRNPVYTAKQVADLDWLSDGRMDFGIGVGWQAEEFAALGVPFEKRGARCRSYLEVMQRLWEDPVSRHEDEFYSLPPCRQYPKPQQSPFPPLYFGGHTDPALRRVADLGQGWFPFNFLPDDLAAGMSRLDPLLQERGRSRDDLQVSVCPYLKPVQPDDLGRYEEAGADQLVLLLPAFNMASLEAVLDDLSHRFVTPAAALS